MYYGHVIVLRKINEAIIEAFRIKGKRFTRTGYRDGHLVHNTTRHAYKFVFDLASEDCDIGIRHIFRG